MASSAGRDAVSLPLTAGGCYRSGFVQSASTSTVEIWFRIISWPCFIKLACPINFKTCVVASATWSRAVISHGNAIVPAALSSSTPRSLSAKNSTRSATWPIFTRYAVLVCMHAKLRPGLGGSTCLTCFLTLAVCLLQLELLTESSSWLLSNLEGCAQATH